MSKPSTISSNKNFVRHIIRHYLKYDKENPFIFISAILAFFGIATGVMVLMLSMGIMNGMQKSFTEKLFVMNYPLTLLPLKEEAINDSLLNKLKNKFPHLQFSPYYTTQVISKNDGAVQGPTAMNSDGAGDIVIGGLTAGGYTDFVVSLAVVLYLLSTLIEDLDPDTVKHIKMAMIVIFVYRAMPSVGPALQWWEIDVLKFDESFFAKLSMIGGGIALAGMWFAAKFIVDRSIGKVLIFLTVIGSILSLPILAMYYDIHTMLGLDARTVALVDTALASPFDYIAGVLMLTLVAIYAPEGKKGTWFALMASLMNIALSASGLFSKYLNKIFVLTREIKEKGTVVTPANYDDLGVLLWIVIGVGFVLPIVTIWMFNPDPKHVVDSKENVTGEK